MDESLNLHDEQIEKARTILKDSGYNYLLIVDSGHHNILSSTGLFSTEAFFNIVRVSLRLFLKITDMQYPGNVLSPLFKAQLDLIDGVLDVTDNDTTDTVQ